MEDHFWGGLADGIVPRMFSVIQKESVRCRAEKRSGCPVGMTEAGQVKGYGHRTANPNSSMGDTD